MLALTATGPAVAQGDQPGGQAGSAFLTQTGTLMRASQIVGASVIGLDHNRIGEVEEVLLGRDGRVEGVVIQVGGFLGMGGKRVAVPFDQILWNTGADDRSGVGPSASVAPSQAPGNAEAARLAPERMPGAEVRNEVLTAEDRSGGVNPATGPSATGSTGTSTVIVTSGDVRQAQVRMTKADLEQAPEFRPTGGESK